jgi:hypothetical protein
MAFAPAAALRVAAGSSVPAELAAASLFAALYAAAWRVLGADPDDRAVWRRLVG